MINRLYVPLLGLTLFLTGCPGTTSTPTPPDNRQLTEKNAWFGDLPQDAQTMSPEAFKAALGAGSLVLVSTADLAAQQAARDAQFQQDKSFLQALPNKSPAVQALLAEAASVTTADGDRPTTLPGGQTITLFGLGTQLRNAVQAEQLAQSVPNALSDYRLTYDLLPDDVRAGAPSPDSLAGKSLAEVQAALQTVNTLLADQPSPVRPETAAGSTLNPQAVTAGNGTDETSNCAAPTNYVRNFWFPLKNFVSPVKNQANRGTCWAFAAVGALESRERVRNNNAVNLSEQFLVNKVKQDWDGSDYTDGYWSEKALDTAASKSQQMPTESFWTYNGSGAKSAAQPGDPPSAGYLHSCDNYTGSCSNTAHQSRRFCATEEGRKYCAYEKVDFGGPGVASGTTTQIWNSGDAYFDLYQYRLLLNQGHVILASFPVYKGFQVDVGANGQVSNYKKTYIDAKGNEVAGSYGGHVVQIVGFLSNRDLSTPASTVNIGGGGYFIIKNSWGCGRGDGGYYYVPADYVQQIFTTLSVLDFDKARSDAWKKEQSRQTVSVPRSPVTVDLRVETDLAQFFTVNRPNTPTPTLSVSSNKDGSLYNGPWTVNPGTLFGPSLKYTFTAPGTRTLTLVSTYGGNQASNTLDVNVVNTPPTVNFSGSGQAHQGEPYPIAAQIIDPNEADPGKLCATAKWSVSAPDTVSPTTGCLVTVTFNTREPQGQRLVQLSVTDSDGEGTVSNDLVPVQPPVENPYPKITGSGVYSHDIRYVPPGTVSESYCVDNPKPSGATIDLREDGCERVPYSFPPRYSAQVKVDNPSVEALTYDWTLYRNNPDSTQTVLTSVMASTSAVFPLRVGNNSNPGTDSCRVEVRVNAPDPSRSKSQTVWTGSCTYNHSNIN